jgi:molybdenum cofactor cytidylyltransferase
MIKVVLLAAGKSTRTSEMKQLYKVDDTYLINMQIKKVLRYGYKIVVVLGHRYKELVEILDKEVEVVHNKEYEKGMFSSVQSVFQKSNATQFLFCHADRPIADKEVFEQLLASELDVAVAFCCGKKAPPIMMKEVVKENILNSKQIRLDYWIKSYKDVDYVQVKDEKVHFNANSDRELKKYFKGVSDAD